MTKNMYKTVFAALGYATTPVHESNISTPSQPTPASSGMYNDVFRALGYKQPTTTNNNHDFDCFNDYLSKSSLDMKPWQWDGVQWALQQERHGHEVGQIRCGDLEIPHIVRGGLLADEMGLGKTIQMIGTMTCNPLNRTLIVLPRALIEQWEQAIIKTTSIVPLVYHGSSRNKLTLDDITKFSIVITTYHLIASKKDAKSKKKKDKEKKTNTDTTPPTILHCLKWDRIIYDEAHHLRNDGTAIGAGAKRLNADIRWLVTGTPIQNRKADFYTLCEQMGLPRHYYSNVDNLMTLVRCFIKKRSKSSVGIKLPELITTTHTVEWKDKTERNLAENIHSMLEFSKINKQQIDNTIAKMDMPQLALLIRARQVCVYPELMRRRMSDYIVTGLIEETDDVISGTYGASKMSAVIDKIVDRRDNGKAKLVFCHFRGEIDYISNALSREGLRVNTFDGRIKESNRRSILESNECDVLVLQIQTGCEGLNLQQFSEIYFVSPHWNPAVEDQAVARCHRIGQQKDVEVFRFTMAGFDDSGLTQTLDAYSAKVQDVKREVMTLIEKDSTDKR